MLQTASRDSIRHEKHAHILSAGCGWHAHHHTQRVPRRRFEICPIECAPLFSNDFSEIKALATAFFDVLLSMSTTFLSQAASLLVSLHFLTHLYSTSKLKIDIKVLGHVRVANSYQIVLFEKLEVPSAAANSVPRHPSN
jgi:G:T-mismatch repair DNA endonuclease (very short patch repair protein)